MWMLVRARSDAAASGRSARPKNAFHYYRRKTKFFESLTRYVDCLNYGLRRTAAHDEANEARADCGRAGRELVQQLVTQHVRSSLLERSDAVAVLSSHLCRRGKT
ncbi:hypothetical protein EVAR_35283_1 [Eumeta japonica]|uniref:Uncharacterized protein n=1 Tax=Eumeta variegata TaxID=151549 RepID=A0A4C1VEN3_EUMVA|nr:hypothetical protein EVAR_35283_1 [Eumeta japonica]